MSKNIHVLIVEDAVDLGRDLKTAIQDLSADLTITTVPSAEEGILEVGRHIVDILVTDFRLPGISGVELVRRVQRKHPGVKVLLTTAILDAQLEKEAEDLHVLQVLKKPVDLDEFRQTVAISIGVEIVAPAKKSPAPEKTESGQSSQTSVEKDEDQLSKALYKLHQSLKARCTLWMDQDGGIEKAFGDLPSDLPRDVIRQAGKKVAAASRDMGSLILSHGKASLYFFPGITSDFLAASSGEEVIAAVFSPGLEPSGFAEKTSAILEGYKNLRVYGLNNQTNTSPSNQSVGKKTQAGEIASGGDGDLEKLLGAPEKVSRSDADDFWENASTDAKPDLGNPDLLTYEQAQKMGLKVKK